MAPLPLRSGAYTAQSLLVSAQRCVNLYPEASPENVSPNLPVAHYPRPGLPLLAQPSAPGRGRGLYRATNGDLFAVIDQSVYFISSDFTFTLLGQLLTSSTNPVSMADNGTAAIIVDGTAQGFQIQLNGHAMTQIVDVNFLGSTRADFLDSFLILNKPGTKQWYSTISGQLAFNALFVGVKTAWPDNVLATVAIEREVWVFGPQKTEVWYNAGTVPFPFQLLAGNIIEQGCAAQFSPAKIDTSVYWLSQAPEGDRMVMRGNSQNIAQRISTHAIEVEMRKYPRVDDAIGSTYQISGHSFYKLHFPTADKTWGYDEITQQWHEDNAIDANGVLHRAHNTFNAFAYGKNVVLDWANGNLYQIDPFSFTDNGAPIAWIRSYPHIVNELKLVSHREFTADVETGMSVGTSETATLQSPWNRGFSSGFGPIIKVEAPQLAMRYSKDGGHTFSNNRIKQLVSSGHYRTMQRFRSMGVARDMVYEVASTAQMISAVHGAYVDPLSGSA